MRTCSHIARARVLALIYLKMASNATAVNSAVNVVEYDFVEKPSEEFFCPVTFELLLDPVQANSCCGNHLSRAVAERLKAGRKPCPMCKTAPLRTVEDLFFKRKVRQLKIRCSNKSSGCMWVGDLGELENHLKLGSVEGRCVYVECSLGCGQRVKRSSLKEHQSDDCTNRPFTCEYCDYKSTHEIIVNEHWSKCQRYPKVCPNKCSTTEIEARFLQRHLREECPLEKIQCEFSLAGCQTKVKRKLMKEHLDETKDEHLKMTASKCKKLEIELQNLTLAFTKFAPKPVFIEPPAFVMTDFEQYKECWFSPAFYTHVGGYKMCLQIETVSSEGTHLGLYVCIMKGEFDSHLKWPFKGVITVELVNQKEGGVKYERNPVNAMDNWSFQRVTKGNRGEGWGYPDFISHSDLYKPEEDKEYLMNDTLIFRVTNVKVSI